MTITSRVREQLAFASQAPAIVNGVPHSPWWLAQQLYSHEPDQRVQNRGKTWTREEHMRFLEAVELYPKGPWKVVAAYVGTKTTRQVMTHSQKCREKMARRQRVLESYDAHHRQQQAASKSVRCANPRQERTHESTPTPSTPAPQHQQHPSDDNNHHWGSPSMRHVMAPPPPPTSRDDTYVQMLFQPNASHPPRQGYQLNEHQHEHHCPQHREHYHVPSAPPLRQHESFKHEGHHSTYHHSEAPNSVSCREPFPSAHRAMPPPHAHRAREEPSFTRLLSDIL